MSCNEDRKGRVAPKGSKGSYPSKQQRFGSAPLASFEDLPSDDQQSPEDDHMMSTFGVKNVLDLDSSELLKKNDSPTPTPSPTLTITPTGCQPKSDNLSQNTLTLGLNFN